MGYYLVGFFNAAIINYRPSLVFTLGSSDTYSLPVKNGRMPFSSKMIDSKHLVLFQHNIMVENVFSFQ